MNLPVMKPIRKSASDAGITEYALRRWISEGKVYAVRSGNKYYVSWESLLRFLSGE